jgi:hypothetical protein
VRDSHDRYANIEVSYLLQRMEAYRGLAILTTNQKAALDSAFQRRLRFVVNFPFPDLAEREAIWRSVFPAATPLEGLDYAKLARLGMTGGNIRNIAMNAAFRAADAGTPVTMAHLLRAAHSEAAKRDRAISEAETRAGHERRPPRRDPHRRARAARLPPRRPPRHRRGLQAELARLYAASPDALRPSPAWAARRACASASVSVAAGSRPARVGSLLAGSSSGDAAMSSRSRLLRPAAPTLTALTPPRSTPCSARWSSGQPADRHEQEADRAADTALGGSPGPPRPARWRAPASAPGTPRGPTGRCRRPSGKPWPAPAKASTTAPAASWKPASATISAGSASMPTPRPPPRRVPSKPAPTPSATRSFSGRAITPRHPPGRRLLAHELSHVLQQRALPADAPAPLQREREGPGPAATPHRPSGAAVAAPASRRWHAPTTSSSWARTPRTPPATGASTAPPSATHLPGATLLTDKRSLREVLSYVGALPGPVGNLTSSSTPTRTARSPSAPKPPAT